MRFQSILAASGFLYVLYLSSCAGGYSGPSVNRQKICEGKVTASCPSSSPKSLTIGDHGNCRTNLTLQTGCFNANIGQGQTSAFYFLFRSVNLPVNGSLRVFEYDASGTPRLVKNLVGPQTQAGFYVKNVAQLLTQYTLRPAVTFEYVRYPASANSSTVWSTVPIVQIDYVVVEELGSEEKSYCHALSGYMRTELFCEGLISRINCPSRYSAAVDQANPSYGRQYCPVKRNGGSSLRGLTSSSTFLATSLSVALTSWAVLQFITFGSV